MPTKSRHYRVVTYKDDPQCELFQDTIVEKLCEPCQQVIQKKIRSNKHKPLSKLHKCLKCRRMAIKYANYKVCGKCSNELNACVRCGEKTEVLVTGLLDRGTLLMDRAAIESNVKTLRPKTKQTFQKYMKRLTYGQALDELETEEDLQGALDELENEEDNQNQVLAENISREVSSLTPEDYIRQARFKLNQLHPIQNNIVVSRQQITCLRNDHANYESDKRVHMFRRFVQEIKLTEEPDLFYEILCRLVRVGHEITEDSDPILDAKCRSICYEMMRLEQDGEEEQNEGEEREAEEEEGEEEEGEENEGEKEEGEEKEGEKEEKEEAEKEEEEKEEGEKEGGKEEGKKEEEEEEEEEEEDKYVIKEMKRWMNKHRLSEKKMRRMEGFGRDRRSWD